LKYCVLGDSHRVMFPENDNFRHVDISLATAYNLGNPKSKYGSNVRLMKAIETVTPEETVIMTFGEIDCRGHIYKHHIKQNKPINVIIDKTIERYGTVLNDLRNRGIKIIVCGIPPPGHQDNILAFEYFSMEERPYVYKQFNSALRVFCEKNNYKYLDIYSKTVGEDGFTQPEYAADEVHLSTKAQPFLFKMLEENKMSETPKVDLEVEFKKRVAERVREKQENPQNSGISTQIRNEGFCLYCKAIVHREDKECPKCGKPVNALSFEALKVNHDVGYNPLESPEENFIVTSISGGRVVMHKGDFE
jgi:lysophospholipase L1-like esterase